MLRTARSPIASIAASAAAVILPLSAVVMPRVAQAQGSVVTSYEKIAEGSAAAGFTFREVGLASINQTGRVGFEGQDTARFTGIYTSPGGVGATYTTIAAPSVSGGFQPSGLGINAGGTVVFSVFDQASNRSKVYSGNGGALTWVSDPATAPSLPTFVPYGTFATINDSGAVAYAANSFNFSSGQNGYYVGVTQGGTFSPVVTTSVPGTLNGISFNNFASARINNAGQVAYLFNSTANRGYVYRRNTNGSFTEIATLIQPQTTIGMNDNGFVAYTGLSNTSLLVGNGLTTITIGNASTLDPVSGLPLTVYGNFSGGSSNFISVNNLNQVVFQGGGGNGTAPDGIYVGDGTRILTVAQVGGALFGSTITGLTLSSQAINDLGQVVFTANLADGRTTVVRGTLPGATATAVPEAGSVTLLLLGALPLAAGVVRRVKK